MKRTVVIVQARFGSSRLPGKVMLSLGGKTVLRRVLDRCQQIKNAVDVCCAISETKDSDVVADEALKAGAHVYRGSETDVLARYYWAAKMLNADVILRVTSDCPLLDPAVCDRLLELRDETEADYACNNMPSSWPHGLDCEAVPLMWLERAYLEATASFEREHVMPFIRNHPDAKKVNLSCPEEGLKEHRWTLDTPRDLEFMQSIFEHLKEGRENWDWRVPLELVRANPTLSLLNSGEVTPSRIKASGK